MGSTVLWDSAVLAVILERPSFASFSCITLVENEEEEEEDDGKEEWAGPTEEVTLTLMPSKRDNARSGRSARNVRRDLMAAKSE